MAAAIPLWVPAAVVSPHLHPSQPNRRADALAARRDGFA